MNFFKSKTINFNVLLGAVVMILGQLGVEVDQETIVAVTTIGNIVLRYMTDSAMSDK